MTDFLQVQTTVGARDEAAAIAQALVERRLAACVHVAGPVQSVYRWQGAVEQAEEWVCTAKTHKRLLDDVVATVVGLHRYDCPELIATEFAVASEAYAAWLSEQLT